MSHFITIDVGQLQQQQVGETITARGDIDLSTYCVTATDDLIISPGGTGALRTSKDGNARGDDAIDLQTDRASDDRVASGNQSVIGGGYSNKATGIFSVIAGGDTNACGGDYAVCSGGITNKANANYAVCGGGESNEALSLYSVIVGGHDNVVNGESSVILGGGNNTMASDAVECIIAGGLNTSITFANQSAVMGGRNQILQQSGQAGVIGGKDNSLINSNRGMALGGVFIDIIDSTYSANIAGEFITINDSFYATNVAGRNNLITGAAYSAIVAGNQCTISNPFSFATGIEASTNSYGELARGGGKHSGAPSGSAQQSQFIAWGTTSNGSEQRLYLDGDDASEAMNMPNDCVWLVKATVAAIRTNGAEAAAYELEGVYRKDGSNAIVSHSTSNSSIYESDGSWNCRLGNDSNEVRVLVTGASGKEINWSGTVNITQVRA